MALYPAPAVWAQAPGLSERTSVTQTRFSDGAPSVGFWHVRQDPVSGVQSYESRDIKQWHGHSCPLHQGARVLHGAAATHPCPSVAVHPLPTRTITRFMLHGETKRCSCPATGKAKTGRRGDWKGM